MGWDGECTIEVKTEDYWQKLGTVDVQAFIYRTTGCMIDSSFVETHWDEDGGMAFDGHFLWKDYLRATYEDLEKGHFREPEEVLNYISDRNKDELALAILENAKDNISMRITCWLAH